MTKHHHVFVDLGTPIRKFLESKCTVCSLSDRVFARTKVSRPENNGIDTALLEFCEVQPNAIHHEGL